MSFIIYKHTNKINGKSYIGQTCQDPARRWREDGSGYKDSPLFWKAIQKYGWENFTHEILEEELSQSEANLREQYWIAYYNTYGENANGYNLTPGGNNYMKELWKNSEYKEKMKHSFSESRKKQNLEEKQKVQERLLKGLHESWADKTWRENRIESLKGENNPNSKKVYNPESGQIFNTIVEAAKWCGLKSVSGIGQCCIKKQKTSGKHPITGISLHWCFLEDKENFIVEPNKVKKQVKCLNTGEVFESYSAAARWCGLKDSGRSIKACCCGQQHTAGSHPVTKERLTWTDKGVVI